MSESGFPGACGKVRTPVGLAHRPRSRRNDVFLAVALAVTLPACALFNDNLRAVEKGRFYRSGQMTYARFAYTIRRHDIRTVINLRGSRPEEPWYRDELAACRDLGVNHYDLEWTMSAPPEPASLRQFVQWVRQSEGPVLVHCQAGIHRAGVASAIYRLLEGEDVTGARRELGFFFRDAPIGGLLDLYSTGSTDFARWVEEDYPAVYESRTRTAPRQDLDADPGMNQVSN